MQLPVNVSEVLKIATDMKEAENTPVSVSIFIDDTAPGDLTGFVRSLFTSSGAHTRVTISYLNPGDNTLDLKGEEDAVVIIAGDSSDIGACAMFSRECGVPCMVVTSDPEKVAQIAEESSFPIPFADLVAPVKLESASLQKVADKIPLLKGFINKKAASEGAEIAVGNDASCGPIELDDDTMKILSNRMGKWIVSAIEGKDLAFAMAFQFVRRPLADDAIMATSLQNAAVGFVPFIPGADMPIMTLNQIKMVLQIATAYGQPVDADRIKEIVAILGGAFVSRHIVRTCTKAIPFAGWIFSGGMGFAATEAMGRAMVEYFEAGGDIVGVANVMQKARDVAMDASKKAAASPTGKKVMKSIKQVVSDLTVVDTSK